MFQDFNIEEASITVKGRSAKSVGCRQKKFEKVVRYVNRSRLLVKVRTNPSENQVVIPDPDKTLDDNLLYVVTEWVVNSDYLKDNPKFLEVNGLSNEHLVREDGRSGIATALNGINLTYRVEHSIPLDHLVSGSSKAIFAPELTTVVQRYDDTDIPFPMASEYAIARGIEELADAVSAPDGDGFGFSYLVVNNSRPGTEYWTVLDNATYKLTAVCAPELQDGLYIFGNQLPDTPYTEKPTRVTVKGKPAIHTKFEDCIFDKSSRGSVGKMKWVLFQSRAEAHDEGGWEKIRKGLEEDHAIEMAALRNETERLKVERDKLSTSNEMKALQVSERKAERDESRDIAKHERDSDKLERERVVNESKSVTEVIKTAGAIIGAVAGIVSLGLTLARKTVQSSLFGPLGWLF